MTSNWATLLISTLIAVLFGEAFLRFAYTPPVLSAWMERQQHQGGTDRDWSFDHDRFAFEPHQSLVVWTGEFGRTPFAQGEDGRDHNQFGFSLLMAGGGLRHGMAYGATDEFGYKVVENKVTVYDLHATILQLLGIDHERLTFRYSGRDMRLTDVHGQAVQAILS